MIESVNWAGIFGLTLNPLELVIRGTTIFWFLYLLFRFILRRDVGSIAMADVLIFVIIADASQNALSGSYQSVTDGMVLIITIIFWNFIVDWLAFRSTFLRRMLEPPMLVVVRNGNIDFRVLHKQFMTVADLQAKLRDSGVEEIEQVKLAVFEANGEFSVIKKAS
jgi:uncharacterized membrane protein YcaP (DUF421 family)